VPMPGVPTPLRRLWRWPRHPRPAETDQICRTERSGPGKSAHDALAGRGPVPVQKHRFPPQGGVPSHAGDMSSSLHSQTDVFMSKHALKWMLEAGNPACGPRRRSGIEPTTGGLTRVMGALPSPPWAPEPQPRQENIASYCGALRLTPRYPMDWLRGRGVPLWGEFGDQLGHWPNATRLPLSYESATLVHLPERPPTPISGRAVDPSNPRQVRGRTGRCLVWATQPPRGVVGPTSAPGVPPRTSARQWHTRLFRGPRLETRPRRTSVL